MYRKSSFWLSVATVFAFFLFIAYAQGNFDAYILRIMNVAAIYVILGVSLNLINGFTGQFSLGHAGFMAIGAYTSALLYMSPELKAMNFFIKPLIWPLNQIQIPFFPALLIGGLLAAGAGFLVGAPCMRVKGDYLAIVTYGFSEIIRVLFNNLQSVTNGPLGLKGLPTYTNLWWSWGLAIFTIFFVKRLIDSSYGRALKAIRDDEEAAEAMGVNLFFHKVLAFVVGAFFAGIAGGLLGSLVMTIDPNAFNIMLTFQIVLIVLLGGLGSITGTVISGVLIAFLMEWLRIVETPMTLFGITIPGIAGMRMLIFSIILMIAVLFFRHGILGDREFSWEGMFLILKSRRVKKGE
ncbi:MULTISPECIES: branched-chain amino acid ABC transporter permease [Pseudothermotoga]|jgi:branched-chain amino acid transport system permease protein|uniref:Inner-membrane translocator n=1 Tax=Pseudothermotoga lettingae (strain ATCC BAA-301 / DSM 14385 / NBRC 107922 / TMO) TaxID=416591 RepID=A8F8K9_PSELT|nr:MULTISPECIES: branched-chain amino acid ABC transporter permease [Pseudothermotoga]ABV34493.1 inner-membrane translocator [Pseudothermotoga lettingae TMO]MDI3494561.1 branched-chain amino acid transport system permease protein [Pseudothermotoga sp.]MDK2883562.1 branched-chain amino acid transport system permease protein [Pseudothermotoga sp.]GLI48561.1 branched-chain amino acid ABC transporter permease [Pseudothermotoga lettingae TMO]HBJ80929.1 branched-chain amino acid ABC transporter perm